jgi:hypothetical protein
MPQESSGHKEDKMIELPYSLVIEATEEPDYFGFIPLTWKVFQV